MVNRLAATHKTCASSCLSSGRWLVLHDQPRQSPGAELISLINSLPALHTGHVIPEAQPSAMSRTFFPKAPKFRRSAGRCWSYWH
jgi:hypothetical protein